MLPNGPISPPRGWELVLKRAKISVFVCKARFASSVHQAIWHWDLMAGNDDNGKGWETLGWMNRQGPGSALMEPALQEGKLMQIGALHGLVLTTSELQATPCIVFCIPVSCTIPVQSCPITHFLFLWDDFTSCPTDISLSLTNWLLWLVECEWRRYVPSPSRSVEYHLVVWALPACSRQWLLLQPRFYGMKTWSGVKHGVHPQWTCSLNEQYIFAFVEPWDLGGWLLVQHNPAISDKYPPMRHASFQPLHLPSASDTCLLTSCPLLLGDGTYLLHSHSSNLNANFFSMKYEHLPSLPPKKEKKY